MFVCDLADFAQVDDLARRALGELGHIDVLVNNAGIPKRKHVTALDYATVDQVTHLNYLSPVRLTLAVLPGIVARHAGMIVNVSSVAATLSSPGEAAYDASKAALSVFSEAMAIDLWETGVRVLVVYPGVVDTELFTIPDNDPLSAAIERIPVSELVDGVMDAISRDTLEVYVPDSFKGIASGEASDLEGFLAGAATWVRQRAGGWPTRGETGGGRPTSVDPEPDVSRHGVPTCPASTAGARGDAPTPRPPPGERRRWRWRAPSVGWWLRERARVVGAGGRDVLLLPLRPRQSGCRTSRVP